MALPRIELVQGTWWSLTVLWQDPTGKPINLLGADLVLQLRRWWAAEDDVPLPLLALRLGSGLAVADPESGEVAVSVSAEDTSDLARGVYVAELWADFGGGPSRVVALEVEVLPAVISEAVTS